MDGRSKQSEQSEQSKQSKWTVLEINGHYADEIDDYTSRCGGETIVFGDVSEETFGETTGHRYFCNYMTSGSKNPITLKVPQNKEFLLWGSDKIEDFIQQSGVRVVHKLHQHLDGESRRRKLGGNI